MVLFLSRIFYLAFFFFFNLAFSSFLSHIFQFLSRIFFFFFISHFLVFYLAFSISHFLVFFYYAFSISHFLFFFLSRIFYLAFSSFSYLAFSMWHFLVFYLAFTVFFFLHPGLSRMSPTGFRRNQRKMQEKYIFQTVPEHEKHRLSRALLT